MRKNVDNVAVRCCSEYLLGFALALLACLVISLCSCRGKQLVTETIEKPVIVTNEHHTESVRVDIVRDTLIQRDSIYHYVQGDTTIIERWHYLQGTTNIAKVDTLHIYDSVPYPVTTTKEVTKIEEVNRLYWWQKALIAIGGIALICGALWISWRLRKKKMISS